MIPSQIILTKFKFEFLKSGFKYKMKDKDTEKNIIASIACF